MRLHDGWQILKGHLSTLPDLCGFCGSGSCRLEMSFVQYVIFAVKMKHRQNNCLVKLVCKMLIKKHFNTTMSFLSILPFLFTTI